jgi:hypothetical protein
MSRQQYHKVFEQEHRLGADDCSLNAKDYGNVSINDYSLWNTYHMSCDTNATKELQKFSNQNPNLHFRNGYGYTTGCGVDNDTEVRLNGKLTHEKPKVQLFTRPFLAVPDLSRGVVVPGLESRLVEGDDTTQVRECDRVSEKDFDRFTPLIPCLKFNIQNPHHIIPPWVNGGEDSRRLMKQSQTLEKCGYKYDGKYWKKK